MKKAFEWLLLFFMMLFLPACGEDLPQLLSEELELDVSRGRVMEEYDTHGGFHGDGRSCTVLQFEDDGLIVQLRESPEWKPFTPDETVEILLHGGQRDGVFMGPYLKDEEGGDLMPDIEKGWYRLIDRSSEADSGKDLFSRYSLNFTLALYDAEERNLYVLKMDT